MSEETKPDINAFVEQIQADQEQISKVKDPSEILLVITQIELLALAWHFFQPGANGSVVENDQVTPRSFNWGNHTAQQIQAAVLGTPTLQQKIINLLAKAQEENKKRGSK